MYKKNKDFRRADEIRQELLDRGIVLEDTRQGTLWHKIQEIFGFDENNNPNLILDNRNWGLRPNTGERSLGTVEVTWIKVYKDFYNKVRVDFIDVGGKKYTHAPLVKQATDEEVDSLITIRNISTK